MAVGIPQAAELAVRLGDELFAHPLGREPASLEVIPQPGQYATCICIDGARNHPVDSGRTASLVIPDPTPVHDQERPVVDEVVEIPKTAIGIGDRPLVQLCLHPEYPLLSLLEAGPQFAGIHRRTSHFVTKPRLRWTPWPCGRLSRPRTTTGPPPHPGGIGRRRAFPPVGRLPIGEGAAGMVPTFTLEPIDGVGAQLCPCCFATATPQAFTVASVRAT